MRRTIVELLFLALGLAFGTLIAILAAWAVPGVEATIWTVTLIAMAIEVALQVGPIRRAWRADRAARAHVFPTHG